MDNPGTRKNDIYPIITKGQTDRPSSSSVGDAASNTLDWMEDKAQELGAHYFLGDKDVSDEAGGYNWGRARPLNRGYADTRSPQYYVNYVIAHELAAMLGGDVPWLNEEDPGPEGENSVQSYRPDYQNMQFVEGDIEAMTDAGFNLPPREPSLFEELIAKGEDLYDEVDDFMYVPDIVDEDVEYELAS